MEAIECPSNDPVEDILLAFDGENIGKEDADHQRGSQENESDRGLNHQEKKVYRPARTSMAEKCEQGKCKGPRCERKSD